MKHQLLDEFRNVTAELLARKLPDSCPPPSPHPQVNHAATGRSNRSSARLRGPDLAPELAELLAHERRHEQMFAALSAYGAPAPAGWRGCGPSAPSP